MVITTKVNLNKVNVMPAQCNTIQCRYWGCQPPWLFGQHALMLGMAASHYMHGCKGQCGMKRRIVQWATFLQANQDQV